MTTPPNKMIEVEQEQRYHLGSCEMYETLRGIFPNDRRLTGKSCSCGLKELIKQHREAYVLEENKNGFFAACGVCGVEDIENVEKYYEMYRAELREKVGRDDTTYQ